MREQYLTVEYTHVEEAHRSIMNHRPTLELAIRRAEQTWRVNAFAAGCINLGEPNTNIQERRLIEVADGDGEALFANSVTIVVRGKGRQAMLDYQVTVVMRRIDDPSYYRDFRMTLPMYSLDNALGHTPEQRALQFGHSYAQTIRAASEGFWEFVDVQVKAL